MADKRTAIVNGNIVLESGIIWDGVILIEDGKILEVGKKHEITVSSDVECIDAEGAYVGPGFVDIHVHGGGGYSTSFEPLKAVDYLLQHGETSILATPSYAMNFEELMQAIKKIQASMKESKCIKGMYMEGPYINPDYGAGADQNPWRGEIPEEQFKAFVDAAGTDVKVWTIAPEREGLLPFLQYAREVNPGVVFSVGHSMATPMQVRALGKYRPTLMTHAMNATGRIPVVGGLRSYGPDEYCFKEPDMYAEVISDSCGIHVHPEMQQLLLHTKGIHRTVLITDGTVHHEPAPEQYAHITDLNFNSQGELSGSKLTMDQACRNIMSNTNCGIAQAFIMASTNPAKVIGLDSEIGSITVGKKADLVFVDDRFNVKRVMVGGEQCKH